MKQTKLWLATIAMLSCGISASAHNFEVDGIYYNITSSTDLTVSVTYRGSSSSQYSNEYSGAVTIPSTVTYNGNTYSVTSIGESAFRGCSSLTSITLPEGVTSIGDYAFSDCSSLTSITLPEGVTSIGSNAFRGCSSLTAITIPENSQLTSIGGYAFYYCSSLTAITIPEGVTSIGEYAFYYCWSLTAITLPEGVKSIGEWAFYYCWSLTAITLPEGVTSIGDYAFSDCSSLTSITIPESVTSIGDRAFSGCNRLYKIINYSNLSLTKGSSSNGYVAYYAKVIYQGDELTTVGDFQFYTSNGIHSLVNYIGNDTEIGLPDSYNGENYKIGDCAFYGCSSLTAITIPEGVTSIGWYAFEGCRSLISITLPESVTSIGGYAFDNCTALKKVIIEDGSTTLSLGYNDSSQGLFYDCPLEEVYLGRNLSYSSSYGYSPFYNKDALTNVTIGNEVTEISQYAFYGCDNIHSLTMGNGVLSIASNTFSTPDKVIWLTNTPPTGYTNAKGSINYAANDQHSSLSNLRVYPYLSSIFEVDGVKYVPVSPSERTCHAIDCAYNSTAMVINVGETAIYKRVEMKVMEVMPYTFYGNDHIKEVSVSHLGNIGSQTFSGCSSLKTVTLGDSIEALGDKAFYQCSSLQEIVIPNSVKSVGSYCFSGCSAMKSAVIGDGLTNIAQYTFQNCTGLTNVMVGDGVTTINNYAFTGCSALTNVTLGRSVATINNYAFQNCSSLPEITLPQAVTKVGDYVFKGCSKLADVVIADRTAALALGSNGSSPLFADCPLDSMYIGGKITYNTTSSKGYSPFYRNTSLRSVVITDREEQIYENEFYGCTNLQNVTIGNGVKSIGNYAFSGCSSLAGFSFGSSMETIGEEAFSDCTNLTSITSHAAVPPTCGTQALDDINKWECVLGVPLGNAEAYYAADQWKEFFFIEDVVEVDHYVLTYVVDGEVVHTEVLKHKDPVTMLAEPTKVGYEFSGWDKTIATMPAEDVVISGTFTKIQVDDLIIRDGEESFTVEEEQEYKSITYTRNFKNTNWQALYVPFEIPYEAIKDDFAVAYINDVHQFDDDDNGTIDRTRVEAIKVTGGVLKANYPYMIRAKVAGEKSITVTDATLYAAEENSIDCSSVFDTYTFTGTYSKIPAAELPKEEGYYALSGGSWKQFSSGATSSLGAFRIYMKIDSRDANAAIAGRAIEMRVIGDDEEETTGMEYIESTVNSQQSTAIYDLQGRRVEHPTKGLYIVNGEKVWIK